MRSAGANGLDSLGVCTMRRVIQLTVTISFLTASPLIAQGMFGMMPMIGILVPITLFISVAVVLILRGPVGKALAERIGGRSIEASEETEALHADVDALRGDLADMQEHTRAQLAEMQERLDFAERLLTAGRASQDEKAK